MDDADREPQDEAAAWLAGRRALGDDLPEALSGLIYRPALPAGDCHRLQARATRRSAVLGDGALDLAVAALTVRCEPASVQRAVEDALMAQVLINDRDLPALLRRAWDLIAQAAGPLWPGLAAAVFDRACVLLDLAAEAR
jgi:hypothetical protein